MESGLYGLWFGGGTTVMVRCSPSNPGWEQLGPSVVAYRAVLADDEAHRDAIGGRQSRYVLVGLATAADVSVDSSKTNAPENGTLGFELTM